MHYRIKPPRSGRPHSNKKTTQIISRRQPKGNMPYHDANLGPEQGLRRHRAVHKNVAFLLVKEHFSRGGGNEHSQKNQRQAVQIEAKA